MTQGELQQIEQRLGFSLPSYYRATMVAYPFSEDKFTRQYLLTDGVDGILSYNSHPPKVEGMARLFVIGGDSSEERYFVDASLAQSPVYVFDLETRKHSVKATTWEEYLGQIRNDIREHGAEEGSQAVAKAVGPMWHGSRRRDVIIMCVFLGVVVSVGALLVVWGL